MKKLFKITSIILIQAFLVLDFSWAAGDDFLFSAANTQEIYTTLAPELHLSEGSIRAIFDQTIELPEEQRDFDYRKQFGRILRWSELGERLNKIWEKVERTTDSNTPETISLSELNEIIRVLNSHDPLGQILEKGNQGDKVVVFQVPGISQKGFGLKDLNDKLGYELNTRLIEIRRKILFNLMKEKGLIDKEGLIYSTYKEDVFLVKKDVPLSEEILGEVRQNLLSQIDKVLRDRKDIFRVALEKNGVAIIEGKKIIYAIEIGMDEISANSDEARILADINAHQAVIISRTGGTIFYNFDEYVKNINRIANLREELRLETDIFEQLQEGIYSLKADIADILRKQATWEELAEAQKQLFFNSRDNYLQAQEYFSLLGMQDYIKKWQLDFDLAKQRTRNLNTLVDALLSNSQKTHSDDQAIVIDTKIAALLQEARQFMGQENKMPELTSQLLFHSRAPPMKNPVYITIDIKNMGLMNIQAFEIELQQIEAAIAKGDIETVRMVQMGAADEVTKKLQSAILVAKNHILKSLDVSLSTEVIEIMGGDEYTIVIDIDNVTSDDIINVLKTLKTKVKAESLVDIRVAAINGAGNFREDFSNRDNVNHLAHAKAIVGLDSGIEMLKKEEAQDIHDTVALINEDEDWTTFKDNSLEFAVDQQDEIGTSKEENKFSVLPSTLKYVLSIATLFITLMNPFAGPAKATEKANFLGSQQIRYAETVYSDYSVKIPGGVKFSNPKAKKRIENTDKELSEKLERYSKNIRPYIAKHGDSPIEKVVKQTKLFLLENDRALYDFLENKDISIRVGNIPYLAYSRGANLSGFYGKPTIWVSKEVENSPSLMAFAIEHEFPHVLMIPGNIIEAIKQYNPYYVVKNFTVVAWTGLRPDEIQAVRRASDFLVEKFNIRYPKTSRQRSERSDAYIFSDAEHKAQFSLCLNDLIGFLIFELIPFGGIGGSIAIVVIRSRRKLSTIDKYKKLELEFLKEKPSVLKKQKVVGQGFFSRLIRTILRKKGGFFSFILAAGLLMIDTSPAKAGILDELSLKAANSFTPAVSQITNLIFDAVDSLNSTAIIAAGAGVLIFAAAMGLFRRMRSRRKIESPGLTAKVEYGEDKRKLLFETTEGEEVTSIGMVPHIDEAHTKRQTIFEENFLNSVIPSSRQGLNLVTIGGVYDEQGNLKKFTLEYEMTEEMVQRYARGYSQAYNLRDNAKRKILSLELLKLMLTDEEKADLNLPEVRIIKDAVSGQSFIAAEYIEGNETLQRNALLEVYFGLLLYAETFEDLTTAFAPLYFTDDSYNALGFSFNADGEGYREAVNRISSFMESIDADKLKNIVEKAGYARESYPVNADKIIAFLKIQAGGLEKALEKIAANERLLPIYKEIYEKVKRNLKSYADAGGLLDKARKFSIETMVNSIKSLIVKYHNERHINEMLNFFDMLTGYGKIPFKKLEKIKELTRIAFYFHDLGVFDPDSNLLAFKHVDRSKEKVREFIEKNKGLLSNVEVQAILYMLEKTKLKTGDIFQKEVEEDNYIYFLLNKLQTGQSLDDKEGPDLKKFIEENFSGANLDRQEDRELMMDTILAGKVIALADIYGQEESYLYLVVLLSSEFRYDKENGDKDSPATPTFLEQAGESSSFHEFAEANRLRFLLDEDERYPDLGLGMQQYLDNERNARVENLKESLIEKRRAMLKYSGEIADAIRIIKSGLDAQGEKIENFEQTAEFILLNKFIDRGAALGIFDEEWIWLLYQDINSYIEEGLKNQKKKEELLTVKETLEKTKQPRIDDINKLDSRNFIEKALNQEIVGQAI